MPIDLDTLPQQQTAKQTGLTTVQTTPHTSWLYSCSRDGHIQGRWPLSQQQVTALQNKQTSADLDAEALEQAAIDTLRALKQPGKASPEHGQTLIDYLCQHHELAALSTTDWQHGRQLFLVDYELPGSHLMLSVFSLARGQALNDQQLQNTVTQWVAAGGSCCGL